MEPRPFRIADVIAKTGLSRETLRRLENENVIPSPVRLRGRQRRYSADEVRQIGEITEGLLVTTPKR